MQRPFPSPQKGHLTTTLKVYQGFDFCSGCESDAWLVWGGGERGKNAAAMRLTSAALTTPLGLTRLLHDPQRN